MTAESSDAEAGPAPASPESDEAPEVIERLRRLSAVAGELRSELSQIEPSVLQRLAQRRATSG